MIGNSVRRRFHLLNYAVVAAAALLAPRWAAADVTGEGDVSPLGPVALPIDGGVVTGDIIVGGTLAPPPGTIPIGRLTVDVPAFTLPLIADNGIIGNTIESIGEASIAGFLSEWQLNDRLTVGRLGQGYLNVTGTAQVGSDVLLSGGQNPGDDAFDFIVGEFEGSQGFVTADGFATGLKSSNLSVGHRGQGRIDLTNRAVMTTRIEASVGSVIDLNDNAIGTGYVMLDGRGTRWNIGIDASIDPGNPSANDGFNGRLVVGREGRGTVEIRNQAVVVVESESILGEAAGTFGKVIVNGAGSQLHTLDNLQVGNANGTSVGELHLGQLGEARTDGAGSSGGTFVGALGLVNMTGGVLLTPNVTSAGLIRGDGRIESALVTNTGDIRNAAGLANVRERLVFTGAVANTANIESVGGEIEFQGPVTHDGPNADLVGIDAILRFHGGITSSGGANIFLEDTLIYVPAGSSLASAGSMSLWAGESTLVGDLDLAASNTLNVTLGDPFGRLQVIGDASVGGAVRVFLQDDYLPAIGDSFEIVDADSLGGTFSGVSGGGSGDGFWQATYTGTSAILSYVADIVSPLTADFDGNGVVDRGDLLVWQDNYGLGLNPPPVATQGEGDANGDGRVDGTDWMIWQQQIGSTFPAVPAAGAVPEPSGLALAALGLAALAGFRKRAR